MKKIRFSEFAEGYIEDYAKVNKRSWKDDQYCIEKLNNFFGLSYLNDICAHDIERLKTTLLKDGLSKSRVNRYLALLKKMFNLAIDWDYLRENPVRKVRLFSEKDNLQERILSEDEEKALLKECSEHLRPIVLTALHTGMRRGEILNLRWDQVDLRKRTVRVEKTKSNKVRFIPINDALLHEFNHLKKRNGQSEHVFPNPRNDKPLTEIKTAFNAAKRRAGINGLRFQDLRHCFASRLVERGVDIITVMDLLGHHSVVVTQRYTHSNSDQKKRAVEKLTKKESESTDVVPILSTRNEMSLLSGLFTAN